MTVCLPPVVTTVEPGSNQEQSALVPVPSASRARRTLEWFWRGAVLADKKRSLAELGVRAPLLGGRAQASANLALNSGEFARSADAAGGLGAASAPQETLADATASELYRQSCYWSLCAIAAASDESVGTSYVEAIWDTLDEKLLTSAASSARLEALRAGLRGGSFVYFAELPASEQAAISGELRKLAESLVLKVDERQRAVQRVLLERTWRLSLLTLFALVIAAGVSWERNTREARSDLARDAPWRTSSQYEHNNCISPAQECAEGGSVFFHTNEEKDPWIEFDLGGEREVSAVQVDNRPDCCSERSIPLIVEVSENHKKWRSVAQRDAEFKTWRATFAPVKAHWVRLRTHKVTFLHLARVHIFP
jgi:hypothetical protein